MLKVRHVTETASSAVPLAHLRSVPGAPPARMNINENAASRLLWLVNILSSGIYGRIAKDAPGAAGGQKNSAESAQNMITIFSTTDAGFINPGPMLILIFSIKQRRLPTAIIPFMRRQNRDKRPKCEHFHICE
jgi:hypothetical protein